MKNTNFEKVQLFLKTRTGIIVSLLMGLLSLLMFIPITKVFQERSDMPLFYASIGIISIACLVILISLFRALKLINHSK